MNVFKRQPYIAEELRIEENIFAEATFKRPPYYSKDSNGKEHLYAVCPECDNPIVIVGLYKYEKDKQETAGERPHGRHHKGTIRNLAVYDEDAYFNCPYARLSESVSKKKRPNDHPKNNGLFKYLIHNYEAIIYVLSEKTGIRVSTSFAKKLLNSYIDNEGWMYYHTTYSNLPYMLMFAEPAATLVGRWIKVDGAVYSAIKKHGCADLSREENGFSKVQNKGKEFLELSFGIANRKVKIRNEEKVETFTLYVAYEDKIIFRHNLLVDSNDIEDAKGINESKNSEIRTFALSKLQP